MAICKGTLKCKLYKGDGKPASLYKGTTKITGWTKKTFTSTGLNLIDTYNSTADITRIDGSYTQTVTVQGKNICPTNFSEWESGTYNVTTGVKETASSMIRVARKVSVSASTTYYVHTNDGDQTYSLRFSFRTFGADGVTLKRAFSTVDAGTFTTASDEYYVGIIIYNIEGTMNFTAFQTDFANALIKPFICLNSVSDKSYATFIPNSPSPNYPAPITKPTNFDVVACGKNVFDIKANGVALSCARELTANGARYTSGTSTTWKRYYQPIKLIPNTTYTFKADIQVTYGKFWIDIYDGTNTMSVASGLSGRMAISGIYTYNFTTGMASDYYLRLNLTDNVASVADISVNNAQLEAGSVSTAYEPYKENRVTVAQELRKLPNGVMDTIEKVNGVTKLIRRVGKAVFDGSADENWQLRGTGTSGKSRFYIAVETVKTTSNNQTISNILSDKFQAVSPENTYFCVNGICTDVTTNGIYIYYDATSSFTVAQLKTWLTSNPVTVYYELATPTETVISDINLNTYRDITNITTSSNPQVSMTITTEIMD